MTALASVCAMPGRVLLLTPSRGLGEGSNATSKRLSGRSLIGG